MANFKIKVGDKLDLNFHFPGSANDVGITYTMLESDKAFAIIDPATGIVTPKKPGTIHVTPRDASGKAVADPFIIVIESNEDAKRREDERLGVAPRIVFDVNHQKDANGSTPPVGGGGLMGASLWFNEPAAKLQLSWMLAATVQGPVFGVELIDLDTGSTIRSADKLSVIGVAGNYDFNAPGPGRYEARVFRMDKADEVRSNQVRIWSPLPSPAIRSASIKKTAAGTYALTVDAAPGLDLIQIKAQVLTHNQASVIFYRTVLGSLNGTSIISGYDRSIGENVVIQFFGVRSDYSEVSLETFNATILDGTPPLYADLFLKEGYDHNRNGWELGLLVEIIEVKGIAPRKYVLDVYGMQNDFIFEIKDSGFTGLYEPRITVNRGAASVGSIHQITDASGGSFKIKILNDLSMALGGYGMEGSMIRDFFNVVQGERPSLNVPLLTKFNYNTVTATGLTPGVQYKVGGEAMPGMGFNMLPGTSLVAADADGKASWQVFCDPTIGNEMYFGLAKEDGSVVVPSKPYTVSGSWLGVQNLKVVRVAAGEYQVSANFGTNVPEVQVELYTAGYGWLGGSYREPGKISSMDGGKILHNDAPVGTPCIARISAVLPGDLTSSSFDVPFTIGAPPSTLACLDPDASNIGLTWSNLDVTKLAEGQAPGFAAIVDMDTSEVVVTYPLFRDGVQYGGSVTPGLRTLGIATAIYDGSRWKIGEIQATVTFVAVNVYQTPDREGYGLDENIRFNAVSMQSLEIHLLGGFSVQNYAIDIVKNGDLVQTITGVFPGVGPIREWPMELSGEGVIYFLLPDSGLYNEYHFSIA